MSVMDIMQIIDDRRTAARITNVIAEIFGDVALMEVPVLPSSSGIWSEPLDLTELVHHKAMDID